MKAYVLRQRQAGARLPTPLPVSAWVLGELRHRRRRGTDTLELARLMSAPGAGTLFELHEPRLIGVSPGVALTFRGIETADGAAHVQEWTCWLRDAPPYSTGP